ncbi:MAG: M15 family metallopeptidase [Deferribacteraceae bacterium]|jgi:peptidoglycan L-alanyl-D-glutamate endopeptidase CwlK|nr:M15 family metallopeptidase [Deferribacteraceae bacterium]
MKLGDYQEIFSSNIAKLLVYAQTQGYGCRLREVERTEYQQKEYLRIGKSRTLNSMHIKSLAADIYFTKDGKLIETKDGLKQIGAYWESLSKNNRWGGNFTTLVDCPHFEMMEN